MSKMVKVNPESQKQELLRALRHVREKVLSAAAACPPEKRDTIFLGFWGIRELLAHLAGWDYANLEAAEAVLAERLPAFYAHHDKDWKAFNVILVAQYRRENLTEQIALAKRSHQELAAHLEGIDPDDFVKDTGVRFHGWRVTLERLLRAEISDEEKHFDQMIAFTAPPLIP
jgi:hypothetical protein